MKLHFFLALVFLRIHGISTFFPENHTLPHSNWPFAIKFDPEMQSVFRMCKVRKLLKRVLTSS